MSHAVDSRGRAVLADDPTSLDTDPGARQARVVERRASSGRASGLVLALRRDHERLSALIDRLRVTDPGPERDALWDDVFAGVTAHVHAEREVLCGRLAGDERARELVERATDACGVVEDLLLGVDGADEDDPRREDRLDGFRTAFADHGREHGRALQALADRILEPVELQILEQRFAERRREVEREIGAMRAHAGRDRCRV